MDGTSTSTGEGTSTAQATSGETTQAAEGQEGQDGQAQGEVNVAEGQDLNKAAEKGDIADLNEQADEAEATDDETEKDTEDANKEVESLKEYKKRNEEANETLIEVFDQYPEIPAFIRDLDRGASLAEAFARNFDHDDLKSFEGEPDYEGWDKARKERMDKKKKSQEFAQTLDSNIDFSRSEMDAFRQENKLSEQQAQSFVDGLNELLDSVYNGKVDRKFLGMILKAQNADREIADARKQGEIKGRNENIEAKRADKEKKVGDGLPNLTGKGDAGEQSNEATTKKDPWSDAIDRDRKRKVL